MQKIALYLVATPIGNLSDISERVRSTLKAVDFIAAEDTRVTLRLLNHLGIKKKLISYYEHNKRQRGEEILALINSGQTCALVSDAGMPAISDPGADLVALMYENNYNVSVIPGPCACVSALALSGLDTGRFTFEGFISINKKNRANHLEQLKTIDRTMIIYESPHKLKKTLNDLYKTLGDRKITIVRELTKKYEEVIRGTLSTIADYYGDSQPLGEFVLVIEGAAQTDKPPFWEKLSIIDHIDFYINTGLEKKEAMKKVASDRKIPKSEVYGNYINKFP